jgi:dolichol-phosphate mannosyltransferase
VDTHPIEPAVDHRSEGAHARMVPELSVVVPTFNERANVPILVERLSAVLSMVDWEVIFVDDNSPDGTFAVVRAMGMHDPRVRCIRRIGRRGLAGACIEGALASQARYVAVMDADLQHDEALLPEMLALLRTDGADLVIGSRYLTGDAVPGLSGKRLRASHIAGWLTRRLLRTDVLDPTSGFFMMRREIIEECGPRLSAQGFKILADILASIRQPVRVRELPYRFQSRLHGASKLDTRVGLDFIGLLLAKATHGLVSIRFISFLMVGASGILVHLLALKSVLAFVGTPFAVAQTIAMVVSMTSNFYLNNRLTYRDQRLHGMAAFRGLLIFYGLCSIGSLSNVGVAVWLYSNRPIWWLAGLLGSIVGAVWNYALSSALVWRTEVR